MELVPARVGHVRLAHPSQGVEADGALIRTRGLGPRHHGGEPHFNGESVRAWLGFVRGGRA